MLAAHSSKYIPIVDAHCHLDDYSNHLFVKSLSNSNVREVYAVSNKHKYKNWGKLAHISCQNLYVYETFGMHPKFLLEEDLNDKLVQLENILSYRDNPVSGRPIVAVGEIGLDTTSRFQMIHQKLVLERQVVIASQTCLPLILHCHGFSLYRPLFDSLLSRLPATHLFQCHCIKSDSDLTVIDNFISSFPNSIISLNGATTLINDIDQDKMFKKWTRNHSHIINHLVFETDCPWLCPQGLSIEDCNPCSGIFVTSKWVENVIRVAGKNASVIIQIANDNANKFFRFSTNKYKKTDVSSYRTEKLYEDRNTDTFKYMYKNTKQCISIHDRSSFRPTVKKNKKIIAI